MVVRYSVEFELPDGRDLDGDGPRGRACAARRAGLALPSLCEQGWDLACAVRVLHGELDHSDARRYYDEDERGGFALICTAKARSDRRLRTHQTAAMRRHRYVHGLPAPRGT
jgi:ferredoxin